MVHVAAPAREVPGIINDRQYATADGTSPAAALVAGLASAILARRGSNFPTPERLKRWLQYTSRPSIIDSQADGVAAGVVDAATAMRDPGKHWLDTSEPGWSELRDVEILGWCQPGGFTMGTFSGGSFDPLAHYPYVNVRNVFRIVRDKRTGARPQHWFVYSQYPDLDRDKFPGEVLRIGPAQVAEAERPLFRLRDRTVALSQIEDLIVSPAKRIPIVTCADS
jgi:hypothetical protein